jgi:hypothetical protein
LNRGASLDRNGRNDGHGRINVKILMVLTSHDQFGNMGRKTGSWLEEFVAPYFVFREVRLQLSRLSFVP